MTAYHTLGGAIVPPYYGEYVLPTYASVIGIDLIPNQPPTAPVLSWKGWHQYLLQKIRSEPQATFMHLSRLLFALNEPMTLTIADFPVMPDPQAKAKEAQFRIQIYSMARMRLGAGVFGGGRGGMGGGMGLGMMNGGMGGMSGANASASSQTTQAMANIMTQNGSNILNASMGGGGGGGGGASWFMPMGGAGC
jgi:hypothetical protein